jgi:hypothetical protein
MDRGATRTRRQRPRPRQLVRRATLAVGSDRARCRHGPRPQTARARPARGRRSLGDDLLALHETRIVARRTCRVARMRLARARRLPSCHGFLDLRLSDPRRPNGPSAGNDLFRQNRQQPRDRCRPTGEQLFITTGSPSPCELFMNTVHHVALSSLSKGSRTPASGWSQRHGGQLAAPHARGAAWPVTREGPNETRRRPD